MQITRDLWERALLFDNECKRRGESLSRRIVSDLLHVNDNTAKCLLFALENRNLLKMQTVVSDTVKPNTKELVFGCTHIPYHDPVAVEAMLSYADRLQPDIISILGDLIDFWQISRFTDHDPNKKSPKRELLETGKVGFLGELRARFPNAEIHYKRGNHEKRLSDYVITNANKIYDLVDDLLENKLGLDDLGIKYHTTFYRIGKLWHLHGNEPVGKSYSPENVCNYLWKYTHDHFIASHFHRGQYKLFTRIDGKVFWTGVVGWLAKSLDWAELPNWTQGFAEVHYLPNGNFKATIHEIIEGEVF